MDSRTRNGFSICLSPSLASRSRRRRRTLQAAMESWSRRGVPLPGSLAELMPTVPAISARSKRHQACTLRFRRPPAAQSPRATGARQTCALAVTMRHPHPPGYPCLCGDATSRPHRRSPVLARRHTRPPTHALRDHDRHGAPSPRRLRGRIALFGGPTHGAAHHARRTAQHTARSHPAGTELPDATGAGYSHGPHDPMGTGVPFPPGPFFKFVTRYGSRRLSFPESVTRPCSRPFYFSGASACRRQFVSRRAG